MQRRQQRTISEHSCLLLRMLRTHYDGDVFYRPFVRHAEAQNLGPTQPQTRLLARNVNGRHDTSRRLA